MDKKQEKYLNCTADPITRGLLISASALEPTTDVLGRWWANSLK